MRFFIHVTVGLLLICPTASAQRPEETQERRNLQEPGIRFNRRPGISGSVAANTRFVFVLTSNMLRQADGETLKWLKTAELPPSGGSRSPTSIACNEASVFVFRGRELLRFDAKTLKLMGKRNLAGSSRRPNTTTPSLQQLPSRSKNARTTPISELPEINSFVNAPSDRFLVDLDVVRSGHPYLGMNASRPHSGCHVYFNAPGKIVEPTDPTTYPPIYAVADGYVSRLDEYFRLRPIVTFGREVSNVRYGVTLAIARKDDLAVNFHYSIEPMIDPGNEDFYLPFLRVKIGQKVKKGDIIAYMYLPNSRDNQNSHIHFNLMHARQFQAPAIFDSKIVDGFHARWGMRRGSVGDKPIPACMGFLLSAPENPFGTGAKPRL